MQKQHSFTGIPNDLNGADMQQQTSQNASASGSQMPWANNPPYDPAGGYATSYEAQYNQQLMQQQQQQQQQQRWAAEQQQMKMNSSALAAQQYQIQQNQLTTAMRQKHLAPRPAPYAPSRQVHQQQQQQDMRHLGKPNKSSDSLGMPVNSPGYPPMMPSPVGEQAPHMMMPGNGMPPGQYPGNGNYRYYPPQGQPPYQHQTYPTPGHHQPLTKQPSQLSLRASEASSTPPPPQASSMPLPPRPQSSSVVENTHSGMSHSTSLQSLHEQDSNSQMNPTPPITPKLNPSDMQSLPVDGIRLTLPILNGELVAPFKIPHGQMYFPVTFEISQNSYQSLNGRLDFDIHLKASRVPPHFEQTQPERVAEEIKNQPCQWPPNVMVHVNQVFVRSMAQEPAALNQPISLKRWTRQGQNCVQFQMTNADCICSYHFYVEYVHRPSIKTIMEENLKKCLIPIEKSASSLKHWIRQMPCEPSKSPGFAFNLNDPLNPDKLLIYPVRGREVCQHPDCFDLESFLLFNYKNEGTMRRSDRWKCPICTKFIAKEFETDEFIQCMIGEINNRVNNQYFTSKQMQLSNPNCNYVDEIFFDADLRPKFRRSQFMYGKPMMPMGYPGQPPVTHFALQQQQQQIHYQMMMAANESKKHLSDISPNVKSPSPALQPPPSASPSFNPAAVAGPYYFNNMNNGQLMPNIPPMKPMSMPGKQPMYPQQQAQYMPQYQADNSAPRPPSASAQPQVANPQQYYGNQIKSNGMGGGKQLPMYSSHQFMGQQQQFSPVGYANQPQQHPSDYNSGQQPRPPSTSSTSSNSFADQQSKMSNQTQSQGLPNSNNSHLEHLQFASSPISNPGTPASSTISTSLSSNMLGHLSDQQQQQQQQQHQQYQFQQQTAFSQQQQQMIKNSMNNQHQPLTPQSQAQSIYSNASVSQPSTPSPSTPKHLNNGSYDSNQTLMHAQQVNNSEKPSLKSPILSSHVIDLTGEHSNDTRTSQSLKEPEPKEQTPNGAVGEDDHDSDSSSLENSTSNFNENAGDSQLTDEEKDILTEALTISEIQAQTESELAESSTAKEQETTCLETSACDTLNQTPASQLLDQPFLDLNPNDIEQLLLDLRSAGEPASPSQNADLKLDPISETAGFDELLVYLSSGELVNRPVGQGDETATTNIAQIQTGLLKGFNSYSADNVSYQHQHHHHVELTPTNHHHHHHHHHHHQQPNSS